MVFRCSVSKLNAISPIRYNETYSLSASCATVARQLLHHPVVDGAALGREVAAYLEQLAFVAGVVGGVAFVVDLL